jgi:hypothetical protein
LEWNKHWLLLLILLYFGCHFRWKNPSVQMPPKEKEPSRYLKRKWGVEEAYLDLQLHMKEQIELSISDVAGNEVQQLQQLISPLESRPPEVRSIICKILL